MLTRVLKTFAWSIIFIPIVFLVTFDSLQFFSDGLLGILNLVLIVPLVIIAIIARKKPFVAGSTLIIVSSSLAITYPLFLNGLSSSALLLTELFLFGPPFVAGLIFLYLGRRTR